MSDFFQLAQSYQAEFFQKLIEQLLLVNSSILFAIIIGVPLGVLTHYNKKLKAPIYMLTSVLWTIPSLAMLAFLIPIMGIGAAPAITALTLYAILPIIRSTHVGMQDVSVHHLESAQAIGLTKIQSFRMVEFPLALGTIINGIKTATIICVGVAILSTYVGAGGLGDFIAQGLATQNTTLIMLGAIPAALIALTYEGLIGAIVKLQSIRQKNTKQKRLLTATGTLIFVIFCLPFGVLIKDNLSYKESGNNLVIGSKNFTEQILLGEMISQLTEDKTGLNVIRKFNLGTTDLCHKAIVQGDIDIYPEYTGTAFLTILKKPYVGQSPDSIFHDVKNSYENKYNIKWLPRIGFNNQNAIIIRSDLAEKYNIKTLSDLKKYSSSLKIAAPPEAMSRPDAFSGVKKAYDLKFKKQMTVDIAVLYRVLREGGADIIIGQTTDGNLHLDDMVVLFDDKQFFPSYQSSILIRAPIFNKYPSLSKSLSVLEGKLTNKTMRFLNYQIDVKKIVVKKVAHDFLVQQRLIKAKA